MDIALSKNVLSHQDKECESTKKKKMKGNYEEIQVNFM